MRLYFVMPFVRGAELYKVFTKQQRFPENVVKFYTVQLILAVGHLHEMGIAHRDLKLENILLDHEGFVKLIDFGLAKRMNAGSVATTVAGTPMYIAPEVLNGSGHGTAVDWWAVGILMFEMLFGVTPFWSKNRFEMQNKILKAQLTFPSRVKYSHYKYTDEVTELISAFLNRDKTKRLGAQGGYKEVLAHPYFADVDEEAYMQKKIKPPYKPPFSDKNLSEFFNVKDDYRSMQDTVIPKAQMQAVNKKQNMFG